MTKKLVDQHIRMLSKVWHLLNDLPDANAAANDAELQEIDEQVNYILEIIKDYLADNK